MIVRKHYGQIKAFISSETVLYPDFMGSSKKAESKLHNIMCPTHALSLEKDLTPYAATH